MRWLRFWVAALVFALLPVAVAQAKGSEKRDVEQLNKLNQFFAYLMKFYIEELDSEELVESAIRAMLKELDPHSAYFDAEEMKGLMESLEGEFSGIGVEFSVMDDTVRVVNTIVGGPAEKVGVMANDRIVRVDTTSIIGVTQGEVPALLRGEAGSRVDIDVIRYDQSEPLHFTITRDKIPLTTVDAHYKLTPQSGYIKVNRFGETTMAEFREAYANLGEVENLVIDLRGNGGGLLSQAVEMSNFFLPKGALVVTTEGGGEEPRELRCARKGEFTSGNVVIIINEHSASASEIVAGAIQDWDRGVVVGERSFGKGLVQRQIPLMDGSAARITVSRYHTPSGRAIQRPYTKGEGEEYFRHKSSEEQVDSLKYKTLRLGRDVYGGGGITPDIEVEGDTTRLSIAYTKMVRGGVVNRYTISYLDHLRGELLERYPTVESFDEGFEVSAEMISEMVDMAIGQGVEVEDVDIQSIKSEADIYIRALLAQRLYSTTAYYKIMNNRDSVLLPRIVRLLENWDEEIKSIWY